MSRPYFLRNSKEACMISKRKFLASAVAAVIPDTAHAKSQTFLAKNAGLPLVSLAGKPVTLGLLAPVGTAAVVHFWASWCAPCAMEMQHLSKLRDTISASRLAMLGIHTQLGGETPAKIEKFVTDNHGAGYAQVTAPVSIYHRFNESGFFGRQIVTLPKLYVFDSTGQLAQKYSGLSDDKLPELDALIRKIAAA